MTSRVKQLLRLAMPSVYQSLQEFSTRRRTKYVTRSLTTEIGWAVQSGPFEGMRYVPKAVGSTLVPKLLGCYESELHSTISLLLKNNYQKIIDVGCAEGYYAVGLALKNPTAVIHAFDIDATGRTLCNEMARINGVDSRIITHSECTHQDLQALATPGCLIICDCEGCELELLQPAVVSALADCDLLVELHDVFKPGLTNELVGRFKPTHEIQLIHTQDRDPRTYPHLQRFSRVNQKVAVSELRDGAMQWAFMRSRNGSNRNLA